VLRQFADMNSIENIPETALAWHKAGRGAVLATVVQTWGSAPRPVGSQLVISAKGEIAGSVSGGCVEGAVITEAQEALEDGHPRLLKYGVSDDEAFAVGLACGGVIRILVEPVGAAFPEDMLTGLVKARAMRVPLAYVVDTETWARRLQGADGFPEMFRADRSGFAEDDVTFVAIHNPPLRLIVVGAVHIAQALIPMAQLLGYDVTLIDPRGTFATAERFGNIQIYEDYPDEVLRSFGLDARSAVVTLSHDPKIDDPAIATALCSKVFYLGCHGSKRTHAKRVARLEAAAFTPEDISRIHAPVGLDIGSRGPAEIALSVLAEMTERLRRG